MNSQRISCWGDVAGSRRGCGAGGGRSTRSRHPRRGRTDAAGCRVYGLCVPPTAGRKLILVLFGGGTRFSESVGGRPQHRHVPHLWKELVPRGTLWTNMRVEHRVVHTNCNASIKTGHWEYDASTGRAAQHPTIFESSARDRNRPIRPPGRLSTPRSWPNGPEHGGRLRRAICRQRGRAADHPPHDGGGDGAADGGCPRHRLARQPNMEADATSAPGSARSPATSPPPGCNPTPRGAGSMGSIRPGGSRRHDQPRRLSRRCALACMKQFSPPVMSVDFGEIDCAHYGSWSRYVEAIRRTDDLTWRLWQAAESLPDYRGQDANAGFCPTTAASTGSGRRPGTSSITAISTRTRGPTRAAAGSGCWPSGRACRPARLSTTRPPDHHRRRNRPRLPRHETLPRAAGCAGRLGFGPRRGGGALTVWRHAAGIGPEATSFSACAGRRGGSSLPETPPPAGTSSFFAKTTSSTW